MGYFNTNSSPAESLKNIKNLKKPSLLLSKSKYTVRGGVLGGILGLSLAYYTQKNRVISTVVGIVLGSIGGDFYSKLVNNINIKKESNASDKKSSIQENAETDGE